MARLEVLSGQYNSMCYKEAQICAHNIAIGSAICSITNTIQIGFECRLSDW